MSDQRLSDFSVPRTTVAASLLLAHGESRSGVVFLIPRAPLHQGSETPLELLNRREAVFPFRSDDDGSVLLVTKAQTIRLSTHGVDAGDEPTGADVGKSVNLEVTLVDGSSISGTVTMAVPESRSRLLDYLNDLPASFFAVAEGKTMHYVNRDHVLYVRPLDE